MESQAIHQVETSESGASMTSARPMYPEVTPSALAPGDAIAQPAIMVVAPMPISKQAQRYELHSKFAKVRCEIEAQVSAAVTAKCGQRYKGVFEVRFDNPSDVTPKALLAFCGNGAVFFAPNDLDQHPALKKLRKADEGINLSALMSRVKRSANIDDDSWNALEEMWSDVSKTLYTQGLAPMHILIAGVLAAKGLGGPKINKKLCSSLAGKAGNTHEVMCQILGDLNELLAQNAMVK
jgi:hypothetical protein